MMKKRFQLTRQNAIDENSSKEIEKSASADSKKNSIKRQNAFDGKENVLRKQITVIRAPSM